MSQMQLRELFSQASVDKSLERSLAREAGSLLGFVDAARKAGYDINEEDILSLAELNDEQLSAVCGGFPYEDKNKSILSALIGLL